MAEQDCAGTAFQCFDWHEAWVRTVGAAEGVSPRIVHVAAEDGRTLLLLPLGLYRHRGLTVLRFLGNVVTDYNMPLIDRQFARELGAEDARRLWAAVLRLLPAVDLVWLGRMPAAVDGDPNAFILLPGARQTETAHAARLASSMAEFRAARSTSFFSQSRRLRRRLGEQGPTRFNVANTEEEGGRMLHAMTAQKSRRWRETGGRDLFALPGYLDFYESLTRPALIVSGFVQVAGLQVGEAVVAAHWGLKFRGRLYWLMSGYEAGEWARYSPGRLLLESLVEWCISREDIDIVDLTVGDEVYKNSWADHTLPLYELMEGRSVRGRMFVAAWRGRERLKRSPALRSLLRRLRGAAKVPS